MIHCIVPHVQEGVGRKDFFNLHGLFHMKCFT
jgi:hypothetical protein